jgi:hypothetical protein
VRTLGELSGGQQPGPHGFGVTAGIDAMNQTSNEEPDALCPFAPCTDLTGRHPSADDERVVALFNTELDARRRLI